jgi:hypothetical protein
VMVRSGIPRRGHPAVGRGDGKVCEYMYRIKLTLCALALCLTALTVGVLGAANASAESAPYLKWCALVPSTELKGLWETDKCEGTEYVVNGKYAWAWAASLTETSYCVLGGSKFTENLCEHEGSGPFLIHTTKERPPTIQGVMLTSKLDLKVSGAESQISCTSGSSSGEAESAKETLKEPLTYTGCTVVKPTRCLVANEGGTAGTIDTELVRSKLQSLDAVLVEPESGTVFVTIEYKDKGTEECALNALKLELAGSQTCEWEAGLNLASLDHLLNCKKTGSNLKFGANTATYEGVSHVHLSNDALWKIQ